MNDDTPTTIRFRVNPLVDAARRILSRAPGAEGQDMIRRTYGEEVLRLAQVAGPSDND